MDNFSIQNLKGVIPAMLTVFDKNEDIDEKGTRELVNHLINKGVNGLYLTGSTGEGFTMTSQERMKFIEIVIDENNGRVPIIVHVGAIGTRISIDLAKHAKAVGADAISSVPPFYWKFSENQIIKYYEDIASECDLPMIVYNVPLVGVLGLNTIKRLAKIKNVKAIKYTAASHYEITQIKDEIGSDFLVYSGCDEMAVSGLLAGADGIIGSFFNLIPEVFLKIYDAVEKNEIDTAKKLQRQAVEIIMYTTKVPSFYSALKVMLRYQGINAGYCRRPFENLTLEQEEVLVKEFKELKNKYNLREIDFLDNLD